MFTDPIADMLSRIKNAIRVNKTDVILPASKLKRAIANLMVKEGLLAGCSEEKDGGMLNLRLTLKYIAPGNPVIREIKKVSIPSRRVYAHYNDLPKVLNDKGVAIISTSQGLMTNKDARKRHLGGEVICEIY